MYRLDYTPPIGNPEPNTTFRAADITNPISFSNGLPGTKYHFRVHYTNDTIHDWLTWTASITTSTRTVSVIFSTRHHFLVTYFVFQCF